MTGPGRSAVIVDAVRSPLGRGRAATADRPGGSLSEVHPVDLLAGVIRSLFERNDVDPGLVEDVIVGCVSQVGDQAGPPGRWAWLAAGLPEHVPSTTVERRCGSGQQAAHFGAQAIISGACDVVVVAGVESMSRVPMGSARLDRDPFGPAVHARYAGTGLVPQGISSELIPARWSLDRAQLDDFAARSHHRAAAAAGAGLFEAETVPVEVPGAGGATWVRADETVREHTTTASLADLPAAFDDPQWADRFPEIGWSTTAGNSSQITDGASAMLLMSDAFAARLAPRPKARFHSFAVAASDPVVMLMGTVPATQKVLYRAGLPFAALDHVEINEAFATVPLAWGQSFEVDWERVNPRGGAIALGHPLGASGVRLLTTMVHALEQTGGRYGLQTMCEAGGMANATIIERIDR